jgi:hypothetical protein
MRPLWSGKFQCDCRALRHGDRKNYYRTPKEVWGFRRIPRSREPEDIAREFLSTNASLFRLEPDLSGLRIEKHLQSLGGHHVIFQQHHRGSRIHRAYVTVHMDRARRVYMAKNRFVPLALLPRRRPVGLRHDTAVRLAKRAVPKRRGSSVTQLRLVYARFLWYPQRSRVVPAWRVRLARSRPIEEWVVYVHADTGRILERQDRLSNAKGKGLVFDPSPVTALGGVDGLVSRLTHRLRPPPPEAYRVVTLPDLRPGGRLEGRRATTRPTEHRRRTRRTDRDFRLECRNPGFEEVMAYYHVDAAVRYLEILGYTGPRAIFRAPVPIRVCAWEENNSVYSPESSMLIMGGDEVPDAEDGETLLHEFGHAIQDAICPDFGQNPEARAVGEGFSDYFAASFFADRKPEAYRPCVMSWDGLPGSLEEGRYPPCERRVDESMLGDDFDETAGEHENGKIWSATLWDIRAALGRTVTDTLAVESHFQLDAFTTFAQAARGILAGDRNVYAGKHGQVLRRIFRRHRIGPLEGRNHCVPLAARSGR